MIKTLAYIALLTLITSSSVALYKKAGNDAVNAYKLKQLEINNTTIVKYRKLIRERDSALETQKAIYDAKIQSNTISNANTKRVYVSASCPSLSKAHTESNAVGAEERKAELDRESRQNYYDLRSGIVELEAALQLCLKTWY